MSLPKVAAKIVFTGTKILGRAFAEAGRQAVRNAKYRPEGADNAEPTGADGSGTGNSTQKLTSDLKMTMDEACLILNVKKDTPLEQVTKNYEHLFKANAPPEPPAAPEANAPQQRSARAKQSKPVYSHYLQSKVYRALERIKAERKGKEGGEGGAGEGEVSATSEGGAASETPAPAAPEPPKSKELPGKGPTHNPNEPIQL
ncbi:hypothetical protein NliqN6_6085 [Naganishia liquefaciens]|uniref:Mitochondrial import inner membrane translocase subunit TIM16 n=1 Tax=Naganishia liquefaciens TaxID=104408 RepID=A0A8H3TZ23_9TREE|nr:hypothetical protein NliqN6_6085 [Naganishia liquefaciens]